MPGKKPKRSGPGRPARKYRKPSLIKHGPLDSDVAAFSALY